MAEVKCPNCGSQLEVGEIARITYSVNTDGSINKQEDKETEHLVVICPNRFTGCATVADFHFEIVDWKVKHRTRT